MCGSAVAPLARASVRASSARLLSASGSGCYSACAQGQTRAREGWLGWGEEVCRQFFFLQRVSYYRNKRKNGKKSQGTQKENPNVLAGTKGVLVTSSNPHLGHVNHIYINNNPRGGVMSRNVLLVLQTVNNYKSYIFIYQCINLLIYSYISSFLHSFVNVFMYSLLHIFMYSYINVFISSCIHLFISLFLNFFIYSVIHSFMYSCIYVFISSFLHFFMYFLCA